jgi:hypothetical protein
MQCQKALYDDGEDTLYEESNRRFDRSSQEDDKMEQEDDD